MFSEIVCNLLSFSASLVRFYGLPGPHLKNNWDMLLRDCVERREKNKKLITQKTFKKHIVQKKTKKNVTNEIRNMLFFEIQELGRDLSMTKISYKLTERTTKTEKFEKN